MPRILPDDEEIKVRCSTCFVILAYKPSEVTRDVDSDGDPRYWLECPRCKKSMMVARPVKD